MRQRGSLLACAELKGLGNKPGKKAAYTPPAYGLIAATAEKPSTRPGALLIEGRSAFCPVCFGRRASETFADGVAVTPGSFADVGSRALGGGAGRRAPPSPNAMGLCSICSGWSDSSRTASRRGEGAGRCSLGFEPDLRGALVSTLRIAFSKDRRSLATTDSESGGRMARSCLICAERARS